MQGKEMLNKAVEHFNKIFKEMTEEANPPEKIKLDEVLLKLISIEELNLSDGSKLVRGIATSPRFILVINYLPENKAGVAYLYSALAMELVGKMIFGECKFPQAELN